MPVESMLLLGLPSSEVTIAEGLKGAGYHTAMVGKWHLGVGLNKEHLPTNHGFESYYVSDVQKAVVEPERVLWA